MLRILKCDYIIVLCVEAKQSLVLFAIKLNCLAHTVLI